MRRMTRRPSRDPPQKLPSRSAPGPPADRFQCPAHEIDRRGRAAAVRTLKKIVRVDHVEPAAAGEGAFDESAPPIPEQLGAIGRSAPKEAWEVVPSDLSTRIDEVVYGSGSARP
jgi:hypothetical protein